MSKKKHGSEVPNLTPISTFNFYWCYGCFSFYSYNFHGHYSVFNRDFETSNEAAKSGLKATILRKIGWIETLFFRYYKNMTIRNMHPKSSYDLSISKTLAVFLALADRGSRNFTTSASPPLSPNPFKAIVGGSSRLSSPAPGLESLMSAQKGRQRPPRPQDIASNHLPPKRSPNEQWIPGGGNSVREN